MTPVARDVLKFKECGMCRVGWPSREAFLSDPAIKLIGYQVDFRDLLTGLLLFNHSCKTTLAIPVKAFRDLHNGPVVATRATETDECPGYCLHRDELRPCPVKCECSYVREILQTVSKWPKQKKPAA